MTTRRREAFDQWLKKEGLKPEDGIPTTYTVEILWRAWQASANQYEDIDRRETDKEAAITRGYTKQVLHLKAEVERYAREVAIRKEVHRDDFLRSAGQMAALKMIVRMSQPGSPIYELANEAIIDTWGINSTTKHCDKHWSYRSTCPDCQKAGLSRARGHDIKYADGNGESGPSSEAATGLREVSPKS